MQNRVLVVCVSFGLLLVAAVWTWSPGTARQTARSDLRAPEGATAGFAADSGVLTQEVARFEAALNDAAGVPRESQPRRVIRTASMTLEVQDVSETARAIRAWVRGQGGFLASSQIKEVDGGKRAGELTLRVPEASLDAAMEQMRSLSRRVVSEQSRGTDVTDQAVDLQARLRNLRAAEEEMRAIMTEVRKKSSNTAEVLRVYREVGQLREQIERTQAQLDSLSGRAAMATLSVELAPEGSPSGPVVAGWSFSAQWVSAGRVLTWVMQRLGTVAAYVVTVGLPLSVLFAVPAWIVWRWRAMGARRSAAVGYKTPRDLVARRSEIEVLESRR